MDGGSAAMAGFVYQLLGSASALIEVVAEPAYDLGRAEILVLELAGQHAGIGKRLIQFKYSSTPNTYEIRPSEFADIIRKLEAAQKVASNGGHKVTVLELRSNRRLSPHAADVYMGKQIPRGVTAAEKKNLRKIQESRSHVAVFEEPINNFRSL
jgi:hypothetical protein